MLKKSIEGYQRKFDDSGFVRAIAANDESILQGKIADKTWYDMMREMLADPDITTSAIDTVISCNDPVLKLQLLYQHDKTGFLNEYQIKRLKGDSSAMVCDFACKFDSLRKSDSLNGGLADNMSAKSFNMKQLLMGIVIEREHTGNDKLAMEIAKDHLAEDPNYYSKLKEMENKPLNKSSEKLEKVYYRGNNAYPEHTDNKKSHPENQDLVGHKARNGQMVWSHSPELRQRHADSIYDNFHKISHLSDSAKQNLATLTKHVFNDPDNGVMASGTSGKKGHSELRLRHLNNAMTGKYGTTLQETPNGGIQIKQKRHSTTGRSPIASTTWHFDGKKLKSFGKCPKGNVLKQGECDV